MKPTPPKPTYEQLMEQNNQLSGLNTRLLEQLTQFMEQVPRLMELNARLTEQNTGLMEQNTRLQAVVKEQEVVIKELREKLSVVTMELGELKRMVFGRKSERFESNEATVGQEQLSLFVQHPHEDSSTPTVQQVVGPYSRQQKKGKPSRQALPPDLPRVDVIIEPNEEEIRGWKKIGEEITEELDYIPGTFRVVRFIRPKYASPTTDEGSTTITVAPLPGRVIDKGIPSAGLLAYILVSKFVDHLPFYRLVKMFERIGMKISTSTINDWVSRCVDLLRVLYQLHCQLLIAQSDYLMADETTIQVMDDTKKGKTHTGYFWVYYDPGSKQTMYHYDPGRGGKYPIQHLSKFSGKLQTDGYKVYDAFESGGSISLIACMAHIRRKFEQARAEDEARASVVLKMMQPLYALEAHARENNFNAEQRREMRQEFAKPIMDELKSWLDKEYQKDPPKHKMATAIAYAIRRWPFQVRYLDDGKLEIDNNLVENAIRPIAIGRKNYLFAGSHQGAEWAAILYTLLSSAANCGHNPYEYLRDVLNRLPDQPINYLTELLPMNWKPLDTGMV